MRELLYNQQIYHGAPHFTFMRRAEHVDIYALKQDRLSKKSSLLCFSFLLVIASDIHQEPESEQWMKIVDLYTARNVQNQATFSFFLYV